MQDVYGTHPYRAPANGAVSVLAGLGFLTLLLIIFVTLRPFDPPIQTATAINIQPADGDAIRQASFVGAFVIIVLGGLWARGLGLIKTVPLSFALLLAWCMVSALWSNAPDVVFRRGTLATIVTLSTLLSAGTLGPERAFRYLRIVLVCVLVVNWISIPLISTAVHLPGEIDPKLIGDWRGLYAQKNGAGAVAALTALIFLFSIGARRRWTDYLIVLAAVGFLIGTRSKTSMGLLPVAILAGGIYRMAWRRGLDRAIVAVTLLVVFVLIAAALLYQSDAIARALEDPNVFTGRTEIWKADFAYLHEHLLLGAGFGTVWGTGGPSFLRNYANSAWVLAAATSHNGYLEILVGLGAIGLTLAMLALIVMPLIRFWPLQTGADSRSGIFALYVFILLHNFTESDFLATDSSGWLVFLMVIASLHAQREKSRMARISQGRS